MDRDEGSGLRAGDGQRAGRQATVGRSGELSENQRMLSFLSGLLGARGSAEAATAIAAYVAEAIACTHAVVALRAPGEPHLAVRVWPPTAAERLEETGKLEARLEHFATTRAPMTHAQAPSICVGTTDLPAPLGCAKWAAAPVQENGAVAGLVAVCYPECCSPEEDSDILRLAAEVGQCVLTRLHAEQGREAALQHLEQVYEVSRDAFWTFDLEADRFWLSPTWYELFGYAEGDFTLDRAGMRALIPPEDYARAEPEVMAQIAARGRWEVHYRLHDASGRMRWVRSRGIVVGRNEAGAATVLAGIHEDITQEKHARDALTESEHAYRMLAQNSRDVIWVADGELRLTYVSPAAEELLGYTALELHGLHVREVITPASWQVIQPIIRSGFEKPGTGKVVFEAEHVRKHGERFWAEVVATALLDKDNRVTGFQGSTRDITSRKNAEQEIRLLRRAVEYASDGIAVAEPDGTVIFQNGALRAMLGYPTPGALNAAGGAYAAITDTPLVEAGLESLRAGHPYATNLRLRRCDGTTFDAHLRASPVRDSDGRIVHLMVIVTDITEAKRAEEEHRELETRLRQHQKLETLGQFAGGIAHDFNNLLMSVLGNAELAADELPASSPVQEMLHEIESAAKRASEISRHMLAYSGQGFISKKLVDLNTLLRDMKPMVASDLPETTTLTLELAEHLPPIEADGELLRKALLCLVKNADEALEQKAGSITIATGTMMCDSDYLCEPHLGNQPPPGRYVYVAVSDNGSGIGAELKERIFDPFFSTKFTGRGLGLSMVHGMVRSHNGCIKVESTPRNGSEFRLLFPAQKRASELTQTHQATREGSGTAGTVLLVEDEEAIRRITRRTLERMGYRVIEAADGQEGLERFRGEPDNINCLVLDLMMPQLRGDEVLSAIRALAPHQPVIITSGYSEAEVRQRFSLNRAQAILQKPYSRALLEQTLRRVMKREEQA